MILGVIEIFFFSRNIVNIFQVKSIFDNPYVQLDVSRRFLLNKVWNIFSSFPQITRIFIKICFNIEN